VKFPRASGILLHPTSLPSRYGIGDFGQEAYAFADFLHNAGQQIWQVLPLGPTGYGDSPYQCFSAFAGNPLLVSLDLLLEQGYLLASDLGEVPPFPENKVDFGWVIHYKLPILKKSFARFRSSASFSEQLAFEEFCRGHDGWLDDYALFMALKARHGGAVWTEWPLEIALRQPEALAEWQTRLAEEIGILKYVQFQFFRQWKALHRYCRDRLIRVLGDVPIYVAHDSADIWAHPELFHLDRSGCPVVVAGVPPDYFSATGQLWGNPIYRWELMGEDGFSWWIRRFRATLEMVDIVRLDHFRGFEAFWEVPASEPTAIRGRWAKGPGAPFFAALQNGLGDLPIVAENLGVITPEVEAIRHQFHLPGMSILQFAFGSDPQSPTFRPHNYPREVVAYTGTHDNDTTMGWWTTYGVGDSTRSKDEVESERHFARRYLATDGSEMNWVFIRTLMASVADTVLFPLQDVLGEDGSARMNVPGRPSGNWQWRFLEGQLSREIQDRLKELSTLYERTPIPE
jgi:4-alpha-glucanotransferase